MDAHQQAKFVSVFSIGTVQEELLELCTASDAANLSMTCRGLQGVFKSKLHRMHELYLDVDSAGEWVATRNMMDQLEILSADLGKVRKIVLNEVSAVTLPMLVLIIRKRFTQIVELQIWLQDSQRIDWSPAFLIDKI